MAGQHLQIGEVAERTGLSLRTIRYYGEVDLVTPSSRTEGGFRLYSEKDLARLGVVMRMKPLDFTIEEMRHVLATLDLLEDSATAEPDRARLVAELAQVRAVAQERRTRLLARVEAAEAFLADLDLRLGAPPTRIPPAG